MIIINNHKICIPLNIHRISFSFNLIWNFKDIYNTTNCSSNSSDNSNGYSVGRHSSYEFASKHFHKNIANVNAINNIPYLDSSSSTSSRTFRKNNIHPVVVNSNPVNSPHVTINNTNVTQQFIHPVRHVQYDPDNRMTNNNVIPNTNTNNLNSPNQNAPGHVRFTSAIAASTSSVTSSSSSNITHPKSILRRKNLNSSSNVTTSSNNNNHNNGWNIQGYETYFCLIPLFNLTIK